MPCDHPDAATRWVRTASSRLQMRGQCLGATSLVACDAPTALRHEGGTGRLVAADGQCLAVGARTAALAECVPAPAPSQQFFFGANGAVRAKSGSCVTGPATDYRDCCLALC